MTIREHLILWFGALAVVSMAGFARADEDCTTMRKVAEMERSNGGRIAGSAQYDGEVTDTMLIVETVSAIVLYGFRDGCLVGVKAMEPVRDRRTPA